MQITCYVQPFLDAAAKALSTYKRACEEFLPGPQRPYIDSLGCIHDPRKPSKPRSAFGLFSEDYRSRVHKRDPPPSERELENLSATISAAWKTAPPEARSGWEKQAREEMDAYEEARLTYEPPTVDDCLRLNPHWDAHWRALALRVKANGGQPLADTPRRMPKELALPGTITADEPMPSKRRTERKPVPRSTAAAPAPAPAKRKGRAAPNKQPAVPVPPGIGVPSTIEPWMDVQGVIHDPFAPPAPRSAFDYFAKAAMDEMGAEGELADAHKLVSEFWAEMTASDKSPFIQLQQQDAARYAEDMAQYRAPRVSDRPVWLQYSEALRKQLPAAQKQSAAASARRGSKQSSQSGLPAALASGGALGGADREALAAAAMVQAATGSQAAAGAGATLTDAHSSHLPADSPAPSAASGPEDAQDALLAAEEGPAAAAALRDWQRELKRATRDKKAELQKPKPPVKPRSAFAVFSSKVKEQVKAAFESMGEGAVSKDEVNREIKEMWEQLEEDDRSIYQVLFSQIAAEHDEAMALHEAEVQAVNRRKLAWETAHPGLSLQDAVKQELVMQWTAQGRALPPSIVEEVRARMAAKGHRAGGKGGGRKGATTKNRGTKRRADAPAASVAQAALPPKKRGRKKGPVSSLA